MASFIALVASEPSARSDTFWATAVWPRVTMLTALIRKTRRAVLRLMKMPKMETQQKTFVCTEPVNVSRGLGAVAVEADIEVVAEVAFAETSLAAHIMRQLQGLVKPTRRMLWARSKLQLRNLLKKPRKKWRRCLLESCTGVRTPDMCQFSQGMKRGWPLKST